MPCELVTWKSLSSAVPPVHHGAMTRDPAIRHVMDTALWVAALRAGESRRPDAAFQDDLAPRLAGPRGVSIARSFPQPSTVAWGVVLRTSAIDRLIREALTGDLDTVINVGAGMDTRPYRIPLPPGLRWIEIDFPDLIRDKTEALAGQTARCRVERIGLDLGDDRARGSLLRALGAESTRALIIAEGVIPYLDRQQVERLATDCRGEPAFQHWILDFDNAGERGTPARWARQLEAAPFRFHVSDWFGFFESCGWRARRVVSSAEESERLRRPYPLSFPSGLIMRALPREVRQRILAVSGAALLEPMAAAVGRSGSQTPGLQPLP